MNGFQMWNLLYAPKVGAGVHAIFYPSPWIANPQIIGLFPQISKLYLSANRKLVIINSQVANLSQTANLKFARKKVVFLIHIRIGLPLMLLFTYVSKF
jgi:hypothetical protein